ncbi:MAG: fatty acid hydroxylase [Limisphaerales bacterium]
MTDIVWSVAVFAATAVYASFFEWFLHRFLLHRPLGSFDYPFRTHTLTHHHIFNAFDGYHLQEEEHKDKVPFAWWNAPFLIGLHVPALYFLQKAADFPVLWPGVAAMAAYYAAYEAFHWVMHVPTGRWIEKTAAFRFLDRHHRLHHLFQYKNFNVVLPLADIVLGTFIGKREDAYKKRPQAKKQVLMDSMDATEPAVQGKEASVVEAGKS